MRIVIIEDHPLYMDALRNHIARTVEQSEILEATSIHDALILVRDGPVDLVLLDYRMPDGSGLDALQQVMVAVGKAPVVVISGIADRDEVMACIRAGARGFLPKTLDGELIGMVISLVVKGGTYVPAEIMEEMAGRPSPLSENGSEHPIEFDMATLSQREITMLRMLIAGASNKEIARELGVEEVTVKFYLTRLFRRAGVKNRSQAAALAARSGLTEYDRPSRSG